MPDHFSFYHGVFRTVPHQAAIRPRSINLKLYYTGYSSPSPGAYKALANTPLPDPNSPDYIPTIIFKARSSIALDDPKAALALIPSDNEDVALKAVAALARYVGSTDTTETEASLEELRDLCVEIEGDDSDADEKDKGLVRVLSGTAFARAGEVEEALETLGAGSDHENLDAYAPVLSYTIQWSHSVDRVALIVQIYLSINRPDLAKKEFEKSKRWAEDDLLLQLIESSIGLVTGKDAYADSNAFYTEQLANPSLSSPHLLTARGITRLLKGEVNEAKSDLEESIAHGGGDAEAVAAYAVAVELKPSKKGEADEWWK